MLRDEIRSVRSDQKGTNERLNKIEAVIHQFDPAKMMFKTEPMMEEAKPSFGSPSPRPVVMADSMTDADADAGDAMVDDSHDLSDSQGDEAAQAPEAALDFSEQQTLRQMANEEDMEVEPGPPVPPGEPAMPVGHTTLAGLLLTWPSIREMVQHLLDQERIKYPEDFPISQEVRRGLLRIYGRGEGRDLGETRHPDWAGEEAGAVADYMDDGSDITAQSPGDVWGTLGALTPPSSGDYKSSSGMADFNPDYSENTVLRYVAAFKQHMLNMHPIMLPNELDVMVKAFLRNLQSRKSTRSATTVAAVAGFVGFDEQPLPATAIGPVPGGDMAAGQKRKRSPGLEAGDAGLNLAQQQQLQQLQQLQQQQAKMAKPSRTIHTALVLLVLALGKICLHRERLPDVVADEPQQQAMPSPRVKNGHPASPGGFHAGSPPTASQPPQPPAGSSSSAGGGGASAAAGGPSSTSAPLPPPLNTSSTTAGGATPVPLPSPIAREASSRRSSLQGGGATAMRGVSMRKNYETIPGLEYFALATDIIGNQVGGSSLTHVLSQILAGLYHGQLGRVMESWSYIALASRTIQVVLRP